MLKGGCYNVGGDVDVLYDFEPDYMSYEDIKYKYMHELGFMTVKNIFVLELGKELNDGLYLVHDEDSIRRTLYYISQYTWVRDLQFYTNHKVDEPLFAPKVLQITGPSNEQDQPMFNSNNEGGSE